MKQLVCTDVSIGYLGIPIAENINFSIKQGDYLCIYGENGAGKSTLMKTILGLIPSIAGSVENEKKCNIGYLPQQTTMQKDFPASVEEIVRSGLLQKIKYRPFYTKEEKMAVKDVMEKLGLTCLCKKCYRELSGGQQERVLLARALCSKPSILFLDEPVAGLDPLITAQLYELLDKLNKEEGVTIVMISHDIRTSYKYANYVLHLGQDHFFGLNKEYKEWIESKEKIKYGVC